MIYSGHGLDKSIVTGKGEKYSIDSIHEKFNNQKMKHMISKPRIFIMDCCRGGNKEKKIEVKKQKSIIITNINNDNKTNIIMDDKGKGEGEIEGIFGKNEDTLFWYGSSEGYKSFVNNNQDGSKFLNCLYDILLYTLQNDKYWSLRGNISKKVFEGVKKLGGNSQIPEIRSQLSYSIYLLSHKDAEIQRITKPVEYKGILQKFQGEKIINQIKEGQKEILKTLQTQLKKYITNEHAIKYSRSIINYDIKHLYDININEYSINNLINVFSMTKKDANTIYEILLLYKDLLKIENLKDIKLCVYKLFDNGYNTLQSLKDDNLDDNMIRYKFDLSIEDSKLLYDYIKQIPDSKLFVQLNKYIVRDKARQYKHISNNV